jgi:hypothetical protein
MIACSADESGQILTTSYGRRVSPADMRKGLDDLRGLVPGMKPGFTLFSDLTHLEAMDPDCAADLGAAMTLLSEAGMANVVRVIPDPTKDIGFNIISAFHFHQPVKIHTHDNLAEGLKRLLQIESAATVSAE